MIREIVSIDDAALPQIKDIYLDSFPPEERLDDWFFKEGITSRARAPRPGRPVFHLLAAEDGERAWGLSAANYFAQERDGSPVHLGFLVYLAVDGEGRSRGTGALLYECTLAQLALDAHFRGEKLAGMVFTVERPDAASNADERTLRERRIAFYRRQGARLFESELFENPPLREGDDPIPLHLMFHPAARSDWAPGDLHETLHRLIRGLQADRAQG